MPLLDIDLLQDDDEIRRAYVILGMMIQSYCKTTAATSVPHSLAIPWSRICRELLDLPLVIVAAGTDLWNHTKIDSKRPLELRENMRIITSMTGTTSESFFHLTATAMHVAFGSIMEDLIELPNYLRNENEYEVAMILRNCETFFKHIRILFKRGKQRIDRTEFYDLYRPLLGGYETGVDMQGTTHKMKGNGPSGGQSSMFVMLDCALGIVHKGQSLSFQMEAYKAMPAPHRRFVIDFVSTIREDTGTVRDFILRKPRGSDCDNAYRRCLEAYEAFRSYHLGMATRYLSSTTKGTGNSTFRSLLKEFKMDVDKCRRDVFGGE